MCGNEAEHLHTRDRTTYEPPRIQDDATLIDNDIYICKIIIIYYIYIYKLILLATKAKNNKQSTWSRGRQHGSKPVQCHGASERRYALSQSLDLRVSFTDPGCPFPEIKTPDQYS